MNHLRAENVKKCFSLLKEFIDDAQASSPGKSIAVLALEQLRRVTAGTGSPEDNMSGSDPACLSGPRIFG